MKHEFWHKIWENREIGFHNSFVNKFLEGHFSKFDLREGSRVLIPLCGKTLDIPWLAQQGFEVVGIELNEGAIKELFEEMEVEPKVTVIGELKLYSYENIKIYVGDFFLINRELIGNIDFIYDRAALNALPKNMRSDYTALLKKEFKNVPMLLVVVQYEEGALEGPPFSIMEEEIGMHYKGDYSIEFLSKDDLSNKEFTIAIFESAYMLK